MSRVFRVVLSIGSVLGCAMEANSEDRPVETLHGAWRLSSFADKAAEVAVGDEASLEFDAETSSAHGSAGCNRYFATFEASGSAISFGPVRTSMMACPDEARSRQERAFLEALESVGAFTIEEEELRFYDGSGSLLMTLVPQPSSNLAGVEWIATAINNGRQAVVSVIEETRPTAIFSESGVSGFGGCNRYQAPFRQIEGGIELGPAAATRKVCQEPAGVMEQESQFLAALETAASYRIDRDTLELRTTNGALAVSFRATPQNLE